MTSPIFSLVIPIFNEQETIAALRAKIDELALRLDQSVEVILVNDGSRDQSADLLNKISAEDPKYKIVHFSRNFGHQVAITAGMDYSSGQAVIIMDADLQDPPEVVLQLVAKWRDGYEVVYAVRKERAGESIIKKTTAWLFYRALRKLVDVAIPADVGDFRLVDRKALNAFLAMREKNRFVRGMFSWVGFRQTGVEYFRDPRFAGTTKYPLKKMIRFAFDAVYSFSHVPLRLALSLGVMVSIISILGGFYALVLKFMGTTVWGWTSIVVPICFLSGIQLIVVGVLGEYIARIHDEVKHRPLYIVADARGQFHAPSN
jgi:dolichol-phosphate mannosyltransferase